MVDTVVPASSSVVAFVTTIHAALFVVHLHRGRGVWPWVFAMPAAAFGALAWVLTTPAWLAGGVAGNLAWTLLSASRGAGRGRKPTHASPPAFVRVSVLGVIDETDTIRTFRLSRPPGFEFAAGQFLMVRMEARGERLARCYSISSSPGNRDYLEISVRRQGRVSGLLHDTVRAGATLSVHPPLGRFTLPAETDTDLVLLAGGIGITPLISMLRHVVATQPDRRVTLLYSARARSDVAFFDEITWMSRRHPQVRAIVTLTGDGPADDCRRGRIDEALIRDRVADPPRSTFLICGPLPMIAGLRTTLARLGVAAERIRFEAFEAATAMAATAARDQEAAGVPGRLRLSETGGEIEVQSSETLLDAAERAGASIASFCRAGVCGTCRTRVLSGNVRCSAEALSDEDREHGYVLPCVARVSGDCVLEA